MWPLANPARVAVINPIPGVRVWLPRGADAGSVVQLTRGGVVGTGCIGALKRSSGSSVTFQNTCDKRESAVRTDQFLLRTPFGR